MVYFIEIFLIGSKTRKLQQILLTIKDNTCFQYAIKVALNYDEKGILAERTTKLRPFINKSNQEEINYPSRKDYQKNFEKKDICKKRKKKSCLCFKT